MSHAFITIAIPTAQDETTRGQIEDALDALGNLASPEVRAAFDHDQIVHFMSGSLVRDADDEQDRMLLEMSVDGTIEDGLALFDGALSDVFRNLLQITGHNEGAASDYLKPFVVETGHRLFDTPGLDFSGTPGMSVKRIHAEKEFSSLIKSELEQSGIHGSPLDVVTRLRERVKASEAMGGMQAMLTPEPVELLAPEKAGSSFRIRVKLALASLPLFFKPHLIGAALIATFLLWLIADPIGDRGALAVWIGRLIGWLTFFVAAAVVIIFVAMVIGVIMLRRSETAEENDYTVPDPKMLADARAREDQGSIQNHLTGVSMMKPSPWRRLSLRIGFFMIAQMARLKFRPGHLNDIGTIHFARWVLLPGTNKLVFFSNYGGSWESYLEDFITKAARGLTAAWSNTVGFPKTFMLILDGATDGDLFKRWARRQQIPTRFWYIAYPNTSTTQVRKNAAIRKGFCSVATEDEAAAFLALFASRTRPRGDVERGEVQTLMFGGLVRHVQSATCLVQLPKDKAKARAWLARACEDVSFGHAPNPFRVDQIALSASGLSRLGLTDEELAEFNYPFVQGMGHPDRARALGDIGEDAPNQWDWGGSEDSKRVDAAYLIYVGDGTKLEPATEAAKKARNKHLAEEIEGAVAEFEGRLGKAGGKLVHKIVATNLSTRKPKGAGDKAPKEPFGFADGVSQPKVAGLERGVKLEPRDQHMMAAGEFILGYPDNRANRPLTPTVQAARDPANILPVFNADHDRTDYPEFASSGAGKPRDLGRNGTYFVVRQIEQNVDAFHDFTRKAAMDFADHPGIPTGLTPEQKQQYIGAKLVGRWQDGTSMVRYPQEPGTGWNGDKEVAPDNDYKLGVDDPTGEACPFGSHVRRSNPRDSFTPGDDKQLSIVNRHRILRRGRFYKDGASEGLLFMCANADIERQFEFIQQTWSIAPQFHGLEGEVDPLLGRGGDHGRMTIPTPSGPIFLRDIPDLVTTKGGEYFFLPSKSALRFLTQLN